MIADRYKDYMYNLTKRVIDEIGPRESCSKDEKRLAALLADEWKPLCDKVVSEKFTCSPTAFLGFFPIIVVLYMAAVAMYWLYAPVAFLIAASGFVLIFLEFLLYREFIDPIFPKREGVNVYGTIAPKGEVRSRVIISGHTDSAYEFTLWFLLKNLAIPVMGVAIAAILLLIGASIAKSAAIITGGNPSAQIYNTLGFVCMALYPFVGVFFFFHTYSTVPGAGDDMAGVAVAAGLAKYLDDAKKNGEFFPEHTEIVISGMACEEAGLRGAKRYVDRHLAEFKAIPTHLITFDSIYNEKFLTVVTGEACSGKHNPKLVKLITDIAKNHNWNIKKGPVPVGATDAAAFTAKGISATCILCQDTSSVSPYYHTRFDTMDVVRPEALSTSLQIAIDAIEAIDRNPAL